jgi:hypothetical protein
MAKAAGPELFSPRWGGTAHCWIALWTGRSTVVALLAAGAAAREVPAQLTGDVLFAKRTTKTRQAASPPCSRACMLCCVRALLLLRACCAAPACSRGTKMLSGLYRLVAPDFLRAQPSRSGRASWARGSRLLAGWDWLAGYDCHASSTS